MLKLAHIKPAHVLDWLAYWIADLLKLAPILKNGLTDILKLADIIKTCSWLGLTGILTCWHVKIGWHFAKWADWHAETGRHNENSPVMTQAECWLTCWGAGTGWIAGWHTENLLTRSNWKMKKLDHDWPSDTLEMADWVAYMSKLAYWLAARLKTCWPEWLTLLKNRLTDMLKPAD